MEALNMLFGAFLFRSMLISSRKEAVKLLNEGHLVQMQAFGSSMEPLLYSGSVLTFRACEQYAIDDIVFCKVDSNFIDAHKIIEIDQAKGYLIANNKGKINGWTHWVYGKVVGVDVPEK